MTMTTRPDTHVEREICIAAIDGLDRSDLPEVVESAIDRFCIVRDRYVAARAGSRTQGAARAQARTEAERVDTTFDRAWRRWVATVMDEDGKTPTGAIAGMLGGVKPGRLVGLPFREEEVRVGDLLVQLAERPALAGDPDRRAELSEAHQELSEAVTAYEAAQRAEREADKALREATRAFGRSWSELVRTMRLLLGEARIEGVLPKFVRRTPARVRPAEAPLPEAPPEASAAGEEPAEAPDGVCAEVAAAAG